MRSSVYSSDFFDTPGSPGGCQKHQRGLRFILLIFLTPLASLGGVNSGDLLYFVPQRYLAVSIYKAVEAVSVNSSMKRIRAG